MTTETDTKTTPAAPNAPPAPTALVRAETPADRLARLPGSYADPRAANARLTFAASSDRCHLVSPSTLVGTLPEGCSVAIASVMVDIDHETYPIAGGGDGDDDGKPKRGKRGLSKSALQKISNAAGISWDSTQSRRLDDGSDSRYARWLAVGRVRGLDGSEMTLQATKEMDLRDGSPTIIGLEEKAKRRRKSAVNQIRELRMHIASHAETKAQLRAIRTLGIRTAYSIEELAKPFVVARLSWTGHSNDPETRRANAAAIRERFLGAREALFGPPRAMALPPATPPPPVERATEPLDDDDADDTAAQSMGTAEENRS